LPEKKPPAAQVRPFWSGTITFGLVSIPVDLLAAAQGRQKSMKLVDDQGHALGRRYYCPKDGKVLDNDELVRGYETESGKMVVITDEEFESVAPEKSRDIELKRFVAVDAIAPAFFERPYVLAPDERSGRAYALLAQTMAASNKAGIGSFVMRGHEYLVAILSENGMLRAEVLRYANELRTPEAIGLPSPVKPDAKLVRELGRQIEALGRDDLDLSEMEDLEAEALRTFAQRKAESGQGVISMEALEGPDDDAAAGAEIIDLMDVLRRSLGARAGPAETRRAARAGKAAPTEEAASRKTAARKAAGSKAPTRKTAAKTSPARQRPAKEPPAKQPPATKPVAKEPLAKKPPAKNAAARKAPSRKVPARKTAAHPPPNRSAAS